MTTFWKVFLWSICVQVGATSVALLVMAWLGWL